MSLELETLTIHTECLFDGYNKDRDHSWPYLFNGYSERRDRKKDAERVVYGKAAWKEFQAGVSSPNSTQRCDRDGSLEKASGLEHWSVIEYSLMHISFNYALSLSLS